jgi:hypothetical protein
MPDEMTIQQAADYLREKLPKGTEYYISRRVSGIVGRASEERYYLFVKLNARGLEKEFGAPSGFAEPVRAAVDWAKGREAGND